MKTYKVEFKYFSTYEDESENLVEYVTEFFEAESEDDLDEQIQDDMDFDDSCVINFNAKSDNIETGREWISTEED